MLVPLFQTLTADALKLYSTSPVTPVGSTWKQLVVEVENGHADGFGGGVDAGRRGELVAHHATSA